MTTNRAVRPKKGPGAAGKDEGKERTRSYREQMDYRRLGKTGLWVSAVCLGGHWKRIEKVIGTSEINPYGLPGAEHADPFHRNRHEVVGRCIDAGINYIDACTGGEVIAYARALKGRREEVYLGYSCYEKEPRMEGWRTKDKLLQGFDEGLREAGLEYADLWRITMHEQGGQHTQAETDEMIAALAEAKERGTCRFVGVSSHDRAWIRSVIEQYGDEVDVILTPFLPGAKPAGPDGLFDAVRRHDVGVFGIKPMATNALFVGDGSPDGPHAAADDRRARLALRGIMGIAEITASIPGLTSVHQVDNAVQAVREGPLSEPERAELDQVLTDMWTRLPKDHDWLRAFK